MNELTISGDMQAKAVKVDPPTPLAFELHDAGCALDELHLLIDRLGNRLACVSTEMATPNDDQPTRDAQGSSQATRSAYSNAARTWDAIRRIEALIRDLEI